MLKERDDSTYVVVSDFRAHGPTRGAMDPVLGMCGEVLQPRQPSEPAPVPKFVLLPHLKPQRPPAPKQ